LHGINVAASHLPGISRKLKILLHIIGLSTIGSALFLQTLVCTSIIKNGYFRGFEQNQAVIITELALTFFGIVYFAVFYVRFILKLSLRSSKYFYTYIIICVIFAYLFLHEIVNFPES